MRWLALAATALLVACGADGAPEPPGTPPGLSISGEATVGVVIGGGVEG